MKRILLTISVLLCLTAAQAQTAIVISSGTTIVNNDPANVVTYGAGTFVNNGTYTDNAGLVNVNGGIAFSGTGTTTFYNFTDNAGSSIFNSLATFQHNLTLASGASLNANGNVVIGTGATLVDNGVLTGGLTGLVTFATTTTGICPSYTSTLSNNVSGSFVLYQWQSSPDNTTWTNVLGATGATYAATVTTAVYYRCNISTSNTSFTNSTASIFLTQPAGPTITNVTPLVGFPASSVTITGTTFSATASNDIVYFGATRAAVTAASTTSLTVTVPVDATFAPVTVNNATCALTAYGAKPYLQNYNNAPYIPNTVNVDPNVDFLSGASPQGVVLADFDGDGKTDMAISNSGTNTISIFHNTSTSGSITSGSFAVAATFVGVNPPRLMAVGDIDGDGKLDLVVANGFSPVGSVSVFRNTSVSGTINFAPHADFNVGNDPWNVAIGDIDGDGKPDIAAVNSLGGNVSVLHNLSTSGSVNFGAAVNFATGTTPQGVVIADLDGDGKNDMAVANTGSSNVSVFLNTSTYGIINSGTFAGAVPFTAAAGSNYVAVADIDGDDKLDLAVANSTPGSVSVLRNNSSVGSLAFIAHVDFTAVTAANSIGIGDFDGDGKPDLAIGSGSTTVTILRNTATSGVINAGSFAAHADYKSAGTSVNIAVGDLDGDGLADIAVANFNTGNVSVLKNDPLQPITGTMVVCLGANTTLSEVALGGTWSSANPAIGTVGSLSGIVTGTGVGTVNISYTVPGGSAVATVTVNVGPASTGIANICIGTVTSLTPAIAGGTWSSSNTAMATVGSLTGDVTGIASGAPVISYVQSSGCTSLSTVTVNGSPTVASTTGNAMCSGGSSTVSAVPATGATINWYNAITGGVLLGSANILPVSGYTVTTNFYAEAESVPGTTLSTTFAGGTSQNGAMFDINILNYSSIKDFKVAMATLGTDNVSIYYRTGTMVGHDLSPAGWNLIGSFPSTVLASLTTLTLPSALNLAPGLYGFYITDQAQSVQLTTTGSVESVFASNTDMQIMTGYGKTFLFGATVQPRMLNFTVDYSTGGLSCPSAPRSAATLTVNPFPSAIAGNLGVCMGSTTTLTDAATGGTFASSAPGVATIDPTTGVVTPVGPGNSTITYSLPTSCSITAQLTVNSLPAIITGTMNICPGTTSALADVTPLGTWTSSDLSKATVSVGGVVTGVAAGNPVISYTLGTGCYAVAPMTVNATPAAIAGNLGVCIGLNSTLSDATPGGTWSSSAPATASINPASGLMNGLIAGNSTITYSITGTGCITTAQATVNSNPAVIGGATFAVCTGSNITLTDGSGTSTWTSSDVSKATVGAGTGIVNGVAAGNATITFTMPTGCIATQAVTVNQTPLAITGTPVVCVGSTTALSDPTAGGVWSSSNSAQGSVGSLTGVVTGIAAGTPNIIYTMPTGCSNFTPVTVNAIPTAITGLNNVCIGFTTTLNATPAGGTWTSSDPAFATIGASSGGVTGIAAGTLAMTYSLATGCLNSIPFTVNPVPSAITGTMVVCTGLNTTLNDAVTGGAWTSSNANATVNSTTGVVTGVNPGNSVITYTLPAGCSVSANVTINPSPSVIGGANQVCVGLTTTLTNSLSGGTWTSNNSAQASVVGSTGVVTGVASGTPTISYTLPAGCFAVQPMTVNPTPAPITGTLVVCQNSSVTLNDVTSGGVWSSSTPAVGTVGSISGIVTGVSSGTTNIVYTLAAGCTATAQVTVNPVPNISVFASSVTSQCSGLGAIFTASSTSLGTGTFTATYSLSGATTAIGSTATLTMGASTGTFTTSPLITPGVTTVTLNSLTNVFGCISNLSTSNTANTTTFPLPTAYTVMGTGSYCSGGAGLHVFLSNSVTGVSYQLYYNGVATGAPLGGLPGPLDFGAETLAGTYTVVATNTTTFCVSNMTGSAIISINPLPTVYAVTGGGSYCSGGSGVGIGMANSDIGTTYQLYNAITPMGSPIAGTGAAIAFAPQTVAGIYTAVATNTVTACTNNMSGSANVSINPLPSPITGTTAACVGANTTLSDVTAGGTWTSINTAVATIGSTSGVAFGVAAGTSTISYTLPTGCAITTIVTVNSLPAAIGGSPVACVGSTAALTNTVSGGTWSSSNTALGTIDPASGILTGIAAGNPTIIYTLPTSCFVTTVATINATPAAITGTMNVCTTSTTALSSTTVGGVWTSSNTAYATVGTSTGVVTGVATGIPNITYTVATGCFVIAPVTVNPTPAPISGVAAVCTGLNTTLSDGTPGGAWSSSNNALATVVGSTGVVTGVASGVPFISYTMPTGCNVNVQVTVSTTPTAITGVFSVCQGLTTTLSDGVLGGTWTSGNTAIATVVGTSGAVTGVSAGTASITYTMPGACIATQSVVVNPLPAAIVGANNVCVASSTTLTDPTAGGTWSSSNVALGTVGSLSGAVTGLSSGPMIITYTLPTTCIATLPFTVNALPSAITGITAVCTGLTTNLSDVTAGGTWSSSNTAQATVGSTGVVTGVTPGVPNIVYTLPTGCTAVTPVTVNPSPVAITGSNTVCTTLTTTLTDATSGGTWSSGDISLATVGSTGIVTGLVPGVVVISYTLPAGCSANLQMTVNPQPAAIVGSTPLCTGVPVTFTDATTGGSWSSSNSAVATVGSTGVVTGAGTGFASIIYTLPAGCNAIMAVTVNPAPAAITGTTNVCVGLVRTLGDATGGGLWSSSNTALGSVGSVTGVVTGIAQGPLTITYTLPAGCFATTSFSVNPLPASITGVSTVCVAATTTLSDATSGGAWSSSNVAIASVGSTGVMTGVSAGTPVLTYTLPSGCIATTSGVVNALPGIFSMSGGGSFCSGAAGIDIQLLGSTTGINYQLLNSGSPVGSATPGISTFPIDYGFMTSPGIYTVVATNATTGCTLGMSGSANVSVNPVPTTYTLSGGGSYCAGGTGVAINLSGSTTGINYQLFDGATVVGSPVAGTGSSFSFGLLTGVGVYTVVATNPITGCTATMSGIATISTTPLPTAYTVTGGGGYCTGGAGATIGLSNSDLSISYQIFQAGVGSTIVAGTGSAISFGSFSTATSYTVVATNTLTSCTNNMLGSVIVSVNPLPTAFAVSPTTASYCAGGTGVNVSLLNSTTGVNYQLYNGAFPVGTTFAGTTGSVINFGLQVGGGVYTVIATSASTLCTNTMTGTSTISVNPLPVAYAVSGGGGYCAGGAGLHIFLSNSDAGVTYSLLRGGVATGTTIASAGGALDFGLQTVAGTYTVSASNGCTVNMTGAAVILVNPLPTPYSVTGTGSYCVGGTGLHVRLSSSDAGVNYQLYDGAAPMGSALAGVSGAALDFGLETATGTYTVIATNPASGCTATMTGSAIISTNPLPTVYNVTGGGSYCAGGVGLHVFLSNSTTGISYQLYNGSALAGVAIAGTTGSVLDFGLHTSSGIRYVVATNTVTGCSDTMSGSATIVINPLPTANNVTGGGSYCSGGTGRPVGLDGSVSGYSYQLYNGGIAAGTAVAGTGSAFGFGLFTTPGTYTVVATNTLTGCTNTMTGTAVISVNALPAAYTVTGGGSYCSGGSGLHVLLSSSDAGISYQLNIGASPIGLAIAGTGSAIDFGLETLSGTYTVVASNGVTTCSNNMSGSASIIINTPPAPFTVSGGGSYCSGGSGVDVYITNSNTGVSYQLYNGSSPVGASLAGSTGSALDFGFETIAGTYTVIATNNITGCTATMTGAPVVSINPLPFAYLITGGGNYCVGGTGVHIGLIGSDAGTSYQLYDGTTVIGTPFAGTGTAVDFGLENLTGTYTVVATSAATCMNNMSGAAVVGTHSLPVVFDVTGGGGYCAGGSGVYIGLAGSNTGINYQLYNGSATVGTPLIGTGTILDFGLQMAPGEYSVVAINSSTTCSDTMNGAASVVTNPLPVAYTITGGGSYCVGGAGLNVGLTASNLDVNYQLYHGTVAVGTALGGTGVALDFGPQVPGGMYTVVGTDAVTGCSNDMSGTDTITVNPLPSLFNVTGGGSYCAGGAGFHVGLSGSVFANNYQLYKDGTPLGAPVAGTGFSLDFGMIAVAGNYTVQATNIYTLCTSNMTGSATIVVNPAPNAYAVTGGGGYCSGGVGVHIGLSGSDTGIHYTLYRGSSVTGTPIAGNDSTLDFGLQTIAGAYTVLATNVATGCTGNMTGSAAVAINTPPVVFTMTGGGGYCFGMPGVHITLSGSATGVSYQAYKNDTAISLPIAGTGLAIDFGLEAFAGTYTAIATNATTGCTSNMAGETIVTIYPFPAMDTVAGGGNYCIGGAGVHITLNTSSAGINYQLFRGTTSVGLPLSGTGAPLDFGLQTIAGSYTVVAINPVTTCSRTMFNTIAILVDSLPTVYNVTGGGSYCLGDSGVHVMASGSQTGVNYQLYNGTSVAGSPVAGTGSAIDFGLEVGAGAYTVIATNAATTCTDHMTGSASIGINPLPVAYTVSGGGSYCIGGTGLHIGLSGSATGISYMLYDGTVATGTAILGTGGAIDFGAQTAAGRYGVKATNTATGCMSIMTDSASIVIESLPVVHHVTGGGSYCSGTSGVHIGVDTTVTGVNYQLYLGTSTVSGPVAGSGSSIDFGFEVTAGTYTVVAINTTTTCTSNMAGTAVVSITPTVIPTAIIASSLGDTVCNGTSPAYTATVVNGGSTPVYNWKVNGTTMGSASTFTYSPANGDIVSLAVASSATCAIPDTAFNTMTMTVLPNLLPVINVVSTPGDTICQGTTVNLVATTVNGGTAPVYSWVLNSVPVSTLSTYSFTPSDHDVIFCSLTSNFRCRSATTVLSNSIDFRVETNTLPTVSISLNSGYVAGTVVHNDTLHASVVNGGFHPTYQWALNGFAITGAYAATYITDSLNNNDVLSCYVVNASSCGNLSASATYVVRSSNVNVTQVSGTNDNVYVVPNPNKGSFSIKGALGTVTVDQEVTLEMTDMLGQSIYKSKVMTHNGMIDEHVQLGKSIANGMYILSLHTGSEQKVFHVVIEQ